MTTDVEGSSWPDGMSPETARVALALATIYELQDDDETVERLLGDFLRTAWPSPRAQRQ